MKRLYFLILSLLVISASYAVNPIPSYNTAVEGVSQFSELVSTLSNTDERRELDVESPNPTLGPLGYATVYAYRLDGSRVLGPYTLREGGILRIRIDGKPWGVSVNSSTAMVVSVYISTYQTILQQQTADNYLNYKEDTWGFDNLG